MAVCGHTIKKVALMSFKVENFSHWKWDATFTDWKLSLITKKFPFKLLIAIVPRDQSKKWEIEHLAMENIVEHNGTWLKTFLPNSHTSRSSEHFSPLPIPMRCRRSWAPRTSISIPFQKNSIFLEKIHAELKMYEIYKMYETKWRN